MKGTPTRRDGNIARPVRVPGGVRPDKSGDGVPPVPEKTIPLPKFTPLKK